MVTIQRKIRYETTAHDAHPGRRHFSVHDDPVRGRARVERPGARRSACAATRRSFWPPSTTPRWTSPVPTRSTRVGTVANIVQSLKLPDGNIKVLVEGVERGKIISVSEEEGYFRAVVKTVDYKVEPGAQLEALTGRVTDLFEQYVKLSQNLNYETMIAAIRVDEPGKLADTVGANLQLTIEEKQELLEIFDPIDRLTRVAEMLDIEIEKLNVDRTIQGRVKRQMEKRAKRVLPQREDQSDPERARPRRKERVRRAEEEDRYRWHDQGRPRKGDRGIEAPGKHAADVGRIHRLAELSRLAARRAVEEEVPRRSAISGMRARVLEADHYGLEKIKERILEFLVRSPAGAESQGIDSVFCRASRRR